jgi:glutaredoxin-related protein
VCISSLNFQIFIQQIQILKILEPAAATNNTPIDRYDVDEETGKIILNISLRKELPLVFINGDCVGSLQELTLLHQKGVLENFLKKYDYDIIVIGGGSGGLAAGKVIFGLTLKSVFEPGV